MRTGTTGQRGFVLVSVLWLVVLLTVVATGLAYMSRQSTRALSGLLGGTEARYIADGGTQLVLANLLAQDRNDRLLADGETLEIELPGGIAEVTVHDENGKIDINAAREELLARLLYSLDVEQEQADALADAIADYRDEDDLVRLNGAERDDYLAAGLAGGPKNGPFTSVEELQQVYGMPATVYRAMLPFVTLYSRHQGVNPEVAPLQVLLAISNDSRLSLESYIEQRRQNHQAGLALPPPPAIARQFLSRTRGVTYTLVAKGKTVDAKTAGTSTTVRLRRARSRLSIETLAWQPYISNEVVTGLSPGGAAGNDEEYFSDDGNAVQN